MSRIKLLSNLLINQIAAGECIERPASVVKELVENSLDANSSIIEIEIEEAGIQLIRIKDNGIGIAKEDLEMALKSHATSKIESKEDLFDINTLGFRGEALASIASVSDISISSKTQTQPEGFCIRNKDGKNYPIKPTAINNGTIIEVRDIFFNIPARRKFLKKKPTEMGYITDVVSRLAICYPKVSFLLKHNNRKIFFLDKAEKEIDRIYQVLNFKEVIFKPIENSYSYAKIKGYISSPDYYKSNSKYQYIFVNNRYVKDKIVLNAISSAYSDYLPQRKYALAVIFLNISPDKVDVNVHPAKTEVRYQNSQDVYTLVYRTVFNALLEEDLSTKYKGTEEPEENQRLEKSISEKKAKKITPAKKNPREQTLLNFEYKEDKTNIHTDNQINKKNIVPKNYKENIKEEILNKETGTNKNPSYISESIIEKEYKIEEKEADMFHNSYFNNTLQTENHFTETKKSFKSDEKPEKMYSKNKKAVQHYNYIQVHNSYLILESEDGIIVIDQHAFHERIIYEKLKKQLKSKRIYSQELLFPETVYISSEEMAIFFEYQKEFTKLGLDIEALGNNKLIVKSIPHLLGKISAVDLVQEILEKIMANKEVSIDNFYDEILATMACKSAIKFGDKLTQEEIISLLKLKDNTQNKYRCPHGRPTILKITLKDLEKHFKRR